MEKLIGFRVGKDFGETLGNIAQEKLLYNLDIQGALYTFKISLRMPEEIALYCLHGDKYILKCNEESQEISLCNREDFPDSSYPRLECEKIINTWLEQLEEDIVFYKSIFTKLGHFSWSSTVDIEVNIDTLVSILLGQSDLVRDSLFNKIMYIFDEREDEFIEGVYSISNLIETYKTWVVELFKKIDIVSFMENKFIATINTDSTERYKKVLRNSVIIFNNIVDLIKTINNIVEFDIYNSEIIELFKRNSITSKLINCAILPSDIILDFDAGWLSPEGDFYGMNGEYSDNLHIEMADLLYKDGIIPEDHEYAKDTWLEMNGWVKIHHDWVLFDCERYNHENNSYEIIRHLTENQIKELSRYGKACCSGYLKLGYAHKVVSMILFEGMDDIARTNLFRIKP